MSFGLDTIVKPDDDPAMRYPGGKGKCFQRLINLMPEHATYIETHLGGGAVMRHKRPAQRNIGIDVDAQVIDAWRASHPDVCTLVQGDAAQFLAGHHFNGTELVYCDPPYVHSLRRQRKIYRHEYSDLEHARLLDLLVTLPCMVMISGYDGTLYREKLKDWRLVTFDAKTHVDVRKECVWCNFDAPATLHDASHLGDTFRDRQTVKRRQERLTARFDRMDPAERSAILADLTRRYAMEVCAT